MRRGTPSAIFLASLTLVALGLPSASAEPPDLLHSYRFIPRLSTLHQTGGIVGFDRRLPIYGTYDFITGYRGGVPPLPTLIPYAQFANVDAQAGHPASASILPLIDLEQALNLSGLDGTPIYHGPRGIDVYHFRGEDGQGAKVDLYAATRGPWMYLRGETTPPCCDFFEYDIQAISRQIPYGDFDEDGDVGASDLAAWQTGFNTEGNALSGRDFLNWQRSYGETAPTIGEFDTMLNAALAAADSATSRVIPEPVSLLLIAGFAVSLVPSRWH